MGNSVLLHFGGKRESVHMHFIFIRMHHWANFYYRTYIHALTSYSIVTIPKQSSFAPWWILLSVPGHSGIACHRNLICETWFVTIKNSSYQRSLIFDRKCPLFKGSGLNQPHWQGREMSLFSDWVGERDVHSKLTAQNFLHFSQKYLNIHFLSGFKLHSTTFGHTYYSLIVDRISTGHYVRYLSNK